MSKASGSRMKLLVRLAAGAGLLATALAVFAIYTLMVEPRREQRRLAAAAAAARNAILALDAGRVEPECDAAGTGRLDDAGVDAYLAVRQALAPVLAERAEATAAAWSGFAGTMGEIQRQAKEGEQGKRNQASLLPFVAHLRASARASTRSRRADADLLGVLREVLAGEGLGPRELHRQIDAIERRFLRRPEALTMGLTASERSELDVARWKVQWLSKRLDERNEMAIADIRAAEEDLALARARIAAIERRLEEDLDLPVGAGDVLTARRAELDALGPSGLGELRGELERMMRERAAGAPGALASPAKTAGLR